MTISTESNIAIDGEKFLGAKKIGFTDDGAFVMDLFTTPPPMPRGSYFTVIPISSSSYREIRNTGTFVVDNGEYITIYDDWGKPTTINTDRDVLDALLKECDTNNVPLREING